MSIKLLLEIEVRANAKTIFDVAYSCLNNIVYRRVEVCETIISKRIRFMVYRNKTKTHAWSYR